MRIAQSQGLLPYPSSILGQDDVSDVPWYLGLSGDSRNKQSRDFYESLATDYTFSRSRVQMKYPWKELEFPRHVTFWTFSLYKKSSSHSIVVPLGEKIILDISARPLEK
jgi:hypothetical protein